MRLRLCERALGGARAVTQRWSDQETLGRARRRGQKASSSGEIALASAECRGRYCNQGYAYLLG